MTKTRQQEAEELDARATAGETVVEGGTGGKSLQAQKNLAEGKEAHPSLILPPFQNKSYVTLNPLNLWD